MAKSIHVCECPRHIQDLSPTASSSNGAALSKELLGHAQEVKLASRNGLECDLPHLLFEQVS